MSLPELAALLDVAPPARVYSSDDPCMFRRSYADVVEDYIDAHGIEGLELAARGFKRFRPDATESDFRQWLAARFP